MVRNRPATAVDVTIPISLFSGTKNIFVEKLTGAQGYNEGISCLACHSIQKTDIQGNANYTMWQPD